MSTGSKTKPPKVSYKRVWVKRVFNIGINDVQTEARVRYQDRVKELRADAKKLGDVLKGDTDLGKLVARHELAAERNYKLDKFTEANRDLDLMEAAITNATVTQNRRHDEANIRQELLRIHTAATLLGTDFLPEYGPPDTTKNFVESILTVGDYGMAQGILDGFERAVIDSERQKDRAAKRGGLATPLSDPSGTAQRDKDWADYKATLTDPKGRPISTDDAKVVAAEITRTVKDLVSAKDLPIDQLVARLAALDADIAAFSKISTDLKLDTLPSSLTDQAEELKKARKPDVIKGKLDIFLTTTKPDSTTDLNQRQQLWRAWSDSQKALDVPPTKEDLALADQELTFQRTALQNPKTRIGPDEKVTKEERVARVEARRAQVKSVVDDLDGLMDAYLKTGGDSVSDEAADLAELRAKASEDLQFARMDPKDPYKAALYEKGLRAAMLGVEGKFKKVDANDPEKGEPSLIERLGTQMTKYVDEFVSEAVGRYAETNNLTGGSYRKMMDDLLNNNDGEDLHKALPGLAGVIKLEIDNFSRNMGEVCDRTAKDQKVVGDKLLGGVGIKGVKDIYVADSDPHNGGRRVTILTLEGDDGKPHKVVNKPRDVRVDAQLVGKTNDRSSFAEMASDAIRRTAARREKVKRVRALLKDRVKKLTDDQIVKMTDQQIATLNGNKLVDIDKQVADHVRDNVKDIPTIGYLVPKDDHHYGWVEHLDHGSVEDNVVDVEGAKNYYKQAGRMAAMAQLLRIEDLHQGNIMVSKGQPQLTDLEIAFSSKMGKLDDQFNNWKLGGKKEGDVGTGQAFLTMMDKGIVNCDQKETGNSTIIQNDRLIPNPKQETHELTENLLVLKEGDTLTTHVEGLPNRFKDELSDGFSELIDAFGDPGFDTDSLLDSFKGVHVRYHALATGEQKTTRRFEASKGFPDKDQKSIDTAVVEKLKSRPKAQPLTQVMQDDLKKRDVAYFTQELGTKDVLHNGTTPIKRPGNLEFFDTDGLTDVRNQFTMLRDPEGREFMKKVGLNVANGLAGQSTNNSNKAPLIKESLFPGGVSGGQTPPPKTPTTGTTTPTVTTPKVTPPPSPEQKDFETAQGDVSNKLGYLKGVDAAAHKRIYSVYTNIYDKRAKDYAKARDQMRQLLPVVEKALRDKAATLSGECDTAVNAINLVATEDVTGDAIKAKANADKIEAEGKKVANALAAFEEVERGPNPPGDIEAKIKKARQDAAKARNALKVARKAERLASGTPDPVFDETVIALQGNPCEDAPADGEKDLYHEQQKGGRCGLHASNAFFGKPGVVKAGGLAESSEALLAISDAGVGLSDPTEGNDPAVLVAHIAELAEAGVVDAKYKDVALAEADDTNADGWDTHTGDRLIIGIDGHFVAFRKDDQGDWWQVDSMQPKPIKTNPSDFIKQKYATSSPMKISVIHA